jgi:hypothetical protein
MSEETKPFTVEWNADGSAIVKLRVPFRYDGEERARLTIPALTGKHMRACAWSIAERPTVGQLVEFASAVIEPVGIVDALPAAVARDLSVEVLVSVGKSLGIGVAR